MAVKAGLKAGLIGAGIVLVLTLLSHIPLPFLGCVCCGVIWLAYAGIGALAGRFLEPPRAAGTGAGAGAIAGVISGAVSGLVWSAVLAVQMALTGTGEIASMIDPDTMRQLTDLGLDPSTIATLSGVSGVGIVGGLCCLAGLAIGAALGAVGGAVYCSTKSE